MTARRRIFKVVLLGEGAVGKTSLRRRYLGEGFKEGYSMTIGSDFSVKRLIIDGEEYVAQIWDLAGQQRFEAVRSTYYRGSSGCLLVFDVTNVLSFEMLPKWLEELLRNNDNKIVPLILIGNKSDLRDQVPNCVPRELAEEYARTLTEWSGFEVPYIETSAKTGENVDEAFMVLFKNIVKYYEMLLGH